MYGFWHGVAPPSGELLASFFASAHLSGVALLNG